MTSISFPPVRLFNYLFLYKILLIFKIGTGKIGFDPNKVCESMINAASECLHKYKMDVLFVIYPSTGNDNNQQSYQVILFFINQFFENFFLKSRYFELIWIIFVNKIDQEELNHRLELMFHKHSQFQSRELNRFAELQNVSR